MSDQFVKSVVEFNEKILLIRDREKALLNDSEFKISVECLNEEVQEFIEAHKNQNFIGAIDAIIDLQYFAIGVLYKMGLKADQISRCMQAVHDANMNKKRGVKAGRGDGIAADAVKHEGWVAPEERIAEIVGEEN